MQKVRLGFIGAGDWAERNHMPILKTRDDVEFVAVCALGRETLTRVQTQFGFGCVTEDYTELLAQPLDAVVITSPHGWHYQHAKAALTAGLHVLVEKPMTLYARDAWDLVATAQARGLHLMVPYGRHYQRLVLTAQAHLAEGAIGPVEYIVSYMAAALRDIYQGQRPLDPARPTVDETYQFYGDPKVAGGGQGYTQLAHSIGLLLWLTGLRGAEVFAYMSGPGAQVEIYDAITLKFNTGAIGVVAGAGAVPRDQPKEQNDLRIFGRDGLLALDLDRERLDIWRHDGRHVHVEAIPGEGQYTCDGPPHRFIDLILGREHANLSPGEVGARAVEILEAAYRSATTGRAEPIALSG